MSQRSETLFHPLDGVGNQFLLGTACNMVVHTNLVPAFSTQQPIYGNIVVLTGDVVQGHINSGNCPHNCCSSEVTAAVHDLPMMLDVQRILANQVLSVHFDLLTGCIQCTPRTAFADACDAFICVNLGEYTTVCTDDFYICDFHENPPLFCGLQHKYTFFYAKMEIQIVFPNYRVKSIMVHLLLRKTRCTIIVGGDGI